jgi:hypothetical protein
VRPEVLRRAASTLRTQEPVQTLGVRPGSNGGVRLVFHWHRDKPEEIEFVADVGRETAVLMLRDMARVMGLEMVEEA